MTGDQMVRLVARLAPRSTALVVVDPQNDFCDPVRSPTAAGIVPQLRALISDARRASVQVVFAQVVHNDSSDSAVWRSRFELRPERASVALAGTRGADFHADLRPEPGDLVIVKHRYSAFIGTPLERMLRARSIQTLVFAGVATNVCVESTARDAFQRDFYVVLVSDCTATNSAALQAATEENVRRHFGMVAFADEVVRAWQAMDETRSPRGIG